MGLCSSTNHNRNIKSNLKNNKNNKKKVNFSQKITIKTQNTLKKKSNSNSIEHTNIKLYSFKNYKIFNENIHFSKKPYGNQKYSFLIYDIVCHGLSSPSNIYTIQISFPNYDKIIIETKEGSNPKFKLHEYLELNLNFDLLLTNYMEIELFTLKRESKRKLSDNNNNNNNIKTKNLTFYSHIKFDLLTLIIGPQLYDVTLYSNDGQIKKGRISFKLKSKFINEVHTIAQNFRTVLFKNKFPHKLSDTIIIDFNDNIWKEEKFKRTTQFFTKINEDENNIEYYSKEFDNQSFVYPLTIFDINFSNPIFFIFTEKTENSKIYEINGHSPTSSHSNEIFNECRLQMNRFMNIILRSKYNENYTMKTPKIEYKMVYNIQTEMQKKIKVPIFWEKEIRGYFEWEFKLNNLPLMRQFHYGLFTDMGLRTNEYSLLDYIPVSEKSLSIWTNINIQLKELYDNILKESNEKEIRGMSSDLNEMKLILEESISDYFICFQYKEQDEIYDAQELFLKIGLLMFDIILKLKNEDEQMTVLEIIKNIQIREEFSQTLVNEKWFDYDEENDEYNFTKNVLDKKIIHNYFNFNYNCIKFMDKAEKIPLGMQFISELYVNLYFKFPILRKNMLKSITYGVPENFPNKIFIDEEDSKTYPENRILFWDYLTKEKLKNSVEKAAEKSNPEIKTVFYKIKELVDNEIPFPNLAKRDKFCFNFIVNLIRIIMSKLSKNFYHLVNIHWLNIHGVCNIINSLLYELQNKDPSEYPSTIREVIYPMLNEPKIYVVIINTILFKTNVYDGTSVYFIIDLIDDILKEFDKAFNPYELDLDYNNFYKAVEIIVLTDNSLTLSKLLWLYYSSAHLMKKHHIIEVSLNIFKKNFYKFFFHWGWKVRKVFHYLYAYILNYRLNKKIKFDELIKDKNISNENRTFSDIFSEERIKINSLIKAYKNNNNNFEYKDNINLIKGLVEEKDYILIGQCIEEYIATENNFNEWKNDFISGKIKDYPILTMVPIKDE